MTVFDCISILQLDYKENYQVYKKNDANCCIMIHKNYLVTFKVVHMDLFSQLAEERIKEAIRNGDLDNLEGKGEPLKLDDLRHVPDDLRMGYRILKNSGYLPEEAALAKEQATLKDLIETCKDPEEKIKLTKKLTEKELHYKLLMEKRNWKSNRTFRKYGAKIAKLF